MCNKKGIFYNLKMAKILDNIRKKLLLRKDYRYNLILKY